MSGAGVSGVEVWKTWEGRVIDGKFPLRQLLGGSDHSAVFLTELPGDPPRKAALKLIPADAGDADRQMARWRAATQLSHPHLIRIFETGRSGLTLLYVVMEFAEEDLSQILPQRALEPAEVTDMLPPLLDAAAYLHAKGFVHGRIKPSNVLAVGDQLKLSTDQVVSSTEENLRRRRRDIYDAPETAAGIVSPAGDLWSVGVTLVAALTQNVLFVGEEAEQGGPRIPDTIPEPFRGIVRECLHLDPKRRCSIAEIKARLQPEGRSVPATSPLSTKPSTPVYRTTWRILIPIAVLMVFVLGVLAFRTIFSPKPSGNSGQYRFEVHSDSRQSSSPPSVITQPAPAPVATPPAATATPPTSTTTTHSAEAPPKKASASSGEVVHKVLPTVSPSARGTITGTVKVAVRVEVDPSGKVTAEKLSSPGPSKYFARLALEAAQKWEFSAPQVNGQPAASAWTLRFRFRRTSTEATPEPVRR
jgi:TonB family protein